MPFGPVIVRLVWQSLGSAKAKEKFGNLRVMRSSVCRSVWVVKFREWLLFWLRAGLARVAVPGAKNLRARLKGLVARKRVKKIEVNRILLPGPWFVFDIFVFGLNIRLF